MINRIYVEKKQGFDIEAVRLTGEIKQQLSLKGLQRIRILNRYDVGLSGVIPFADTVYGIFAEINQDDVYFEKFPSEAADKIFGIEFQPGQYDIRCDSAVQCIKLLSAQAEATVRHAKIYMIKGEVSDIDMEKIKKYMINPVDSREASLEDIKQFENETKTPQIKMVLDGFRDYSELELDKFITDNSLAMDLADIKTIRDYFKFDEKRDPTQTELKVLDTYWSDHCRHTTFSTVLNEIRFGEGPMNEEIKKTYDEYLAVKKEMGRENKPVTLMDIAISGWRYNDYKGLCEDIEESDEINACSYHIKTDVDGKQEDYLLMFKNETHNHPTEIEPFGGAATCLGGAIRDPLSGRAYVYQSMRVTGSADPRQAVESTLPGKLPQRKITTQAAAGFSSYGNQIGLCTGQVKEYYHPAFAAKRMEVGAVIAAAPKQNVVRQKPQPGDLIYVIGGRTGRDGIGGASGSSKEHNAQSVDTAGSEVQKGNAPEERKLQRLFRNADCAKLIKKCNDFGAGGVSVAIGELADSLEIQLETLLLKYEGLNPTELAISESQERMAVVIDPNDEENFLSHVREENLEYSRSAVVTDSGRLIMRYNDTEVLNLKRAFIDTNGAKKFASIDVDFRPAQKADFIPDQTFGEKLARIIQDINVCSQKGLVEIFDNTIGASTVLMPYGGRYQLTPSDVMAAKIPVLGADTKTVSLMAHGYDPYLGAENPYLSGYNSVLSCAAKLLCAGAMLGDIKLSLQEYFEKLRTDPKRWAKPFAALLGAQKAQIALGISAIGGKDSMSGSFEDLDVPPTVICFGVAVSDVSRIVSAEFKKSGASVYLLRFKKDANGLIDAKDFKEKSAALTFFIGQSRVSAAKAVGFGGIAETVFKMCIGNKFGFEFEETDSADLFEKDYGSIVLEMPYDFACADFPGLTLLGRTTDEAAIRLGNETVDLNSLINRWETPLDEIFPQTAKESVEAKELRFKTEVMIKAAAKVAKPRVFVPVFPGTNCEYDTMRAFEKAGAVCVPFVFKNKSTQDILYSAQQIVKIIENSQIIAFPGGFSAGDEPDGSGKFIVSVLKNKKIAEAVNELIGKRDGLILGICNGFQALIKTGLLPYGEIGGVFKDSPTLTFNHIGRHVAKVVHTKLVSNKSVWFNEMPIGAVHSVALSHGEGRFASDERQLAKLIKSGQIITQYCDFNGKVIGTPDINPNGSIYNVEAVCSPDGRILGKMGHSERIGEGLYQNLTGDFDQKIFLSGVKYYS